MSDLEKIDNIKKIWKFNLAYLVLLKAEELKFHFNFSSELWQIEQNNRRNRKLAPEYVISGYNSLALSIALLAVLFNKRKKELVLVKNKDDDRKIFKIIQKDKAKILGENYCNILLADPNQFEIKKCKGCIGNIAKMTEKVDKEVWFITYRVSRNRTFKKQKLSKALELVLQKSLVRNMESNEQEFFFYTNGSLQLQKEDQIGSSTKMGLELAAIWLVVLLAPNSTKLTIYSDSIVAINTITSINHSLVFSQFIKLGFSIVSKIRNLVRLKGVCLNLVKVKGHSQDHWNGRANTLAKK
ncbi:44911_t:CDS:2, partial [Gigaspora margarita]